MKFSIITSFFNTSKYVNRLYNSLLSQTYKNWEWVVTDDFSEDSAKDRLIEISKKDSRVRYIDQEFKQEIFWNPHKYSSHDSSFILAIGSDDIIFPKTLEIYKHFFLTHPDIISITSGGERVTEDSFSWKNYLIPTKISDNNIEANSYFGSKREDIYITKAWRHIPYPILDFNPNNRYEFTFEDQAQLAVLEEIGKTLFLNRNLSQVVVRENRLSNPNNQHKTNSKVKIIGDKIDKDIIDRRKGKSFCTFNKKFDSINHILCLLYYGDFNKSSEFNTINILNPSINLNQQQLLKEFYFDFDLRFENYCPLTPYNYYFLLNEEDIKSFNLFKSFKGLIVASNLKTYANNNEFTNFLNTQGIGKYYYRSYAYERWATIHH